MSDERTEAERIDPHQHIDPDDPRYDGFRIRELWAATAIAPDNQEAMLNVDPITGLRFHLATGPAFASDERRRVHLRQFARAIAAETGWEIRIRHFVTDDGMDEVFR